MGVGCGARSSSNPSTSCSSTCHCPSDARPCGARARGAVSRRMRKSPSAAEFESDAFWRAFRPDLTIESTDPHPKFEVPGLAALMAELRHEGYVNVPGVVPEKQFAALRACIEALHERKLPLAFAFVYDQFWHVFQGVSSFLEAVLGPGYRA